jgi:hypothetical protein
VQYVVSLLFASVCYCLIVRVLFFNILLMFVFLFRVFSSLCTLCFCIVLFIVSPFVYSCLSPIFVQVYRPLSPCRNPTAVNKYIISYIVSYIISYQQECTQCQQTVPLDGHVKLCRLHKGTDELLHFSQFPAVHRTLHDTVHTF